MSQNLFNHTVNGKKVTYQFFTIKKLLGIRGLEKYLYSLHIPKCINTLRHK